MNCGGQGRHPTCCERGLATLEWVIITAAAAALAAAAAAALESVIDDGTEARSSRSVHAIEIDTAAVLIERDAREALRADPLRYDEAPFRDRCNSISGLFPDVVSDARWRSGSGPGDLPRCDVRLR